MRMKQFVLTLLLVLFVFTLPAFADEPGQGWKLAKEGDGIQVFTRPVVDSDNDEFLGITDVEAPIKVILEVYRDIPSFPQWFGFCRDIELFRRDTATHEIIYFVLATPWPVSDRDMVIDVVYSVDLEGGESRIFMNALKEDLVPQQDKYVRMTKLIGECVLTRIDEDTTHVTYTVNSDPAGYIPAAISNMLSKNQPYDTLKGLKKMVRDDKYYELAGMPRKK
jgi:hypothetical protein